MAKIKKSTPAIEGTKCVVVEDKHTSGGKKIEVSIMGGKVIDASEESGKVIEVNESKGNKASTTRKTTHSISTTKISDIVKGLQSSNRGQETSTSFKSIYCPNCGKKYYKQNSRYCTQCGQQRK